MTRGPVKLVFESEGIDEVAEMRARRERIIEATRALLQGLTDEQLRDVHAAARRLAERKR